MLRCGSLGALAYGFVAQGFEVLDSQDQTDVVWAGDMNWNADDGEPPLPAGWYEPSAVCLTPAPCC